MAKPVRWSGKTILEVSYAKFRQAGVQAAAKLTLEEFMVSPLRNAYVRYRNLESYVRKSRRIIEGRQGDRAGTGPPRISGVRKHGGQSQAQENPACIADLADLYTKLARQHG